MGEEVQMKLLELPKLRARESLCLQFLLNGPKRVSTLSKLFCNLTEFKNPFYSYLAAYRVLERLKKKGLVSSYSVNRRKKFYLISPLGVEALSIFKVKELRKACWRRRRKSSCSEPTGLELVPELATELQ
ncbi:MAG: hypothetical protein QXI39_01205 [Candidatus Bathyarchaeia archaeon]